MLASTFWLLEQGRADLNIRVGEIPPQWVQLGFLRDMVEVLSDRIYWFWLKSDFFFGQKIIFKIVIGDIIRPVKRISERMYAVNSRIIEDFKVATVAVGVLMFSAPLFAGGTYALTADENWYAHGKMMLADGATVDLAGHKLTVGGFADYVPLDYVETDGTQWVHTEFTPEGTDTFELKFMKKQNTDEFLLCSRSNGLTDGFGVWVSGYSWKDIEFIYRSRGGVGFY